MKAYQHELAHSYEHRRRLFQFNSSSLFQSLITAIIVGVVVALVGVVIIKASQAGEIPSYILASVEGIALVLIVTVLLTILLEQRRKRSIRRTLELAFLNHHIRNAMTQMTMASNVADPEEQQRFMHDAIARVSETLFRVANSADLTGLSLEVDLFGKELAHEGEEREKGDEKNGEVKAKAPPIAIEPRRKRYQSPLNHRKSSPGAHSPRR